MCIIVLVLVAGIATLGDVTGDYGSVVRPQVPQYVTLQILAILQPYPQERDIRDQCIGSDIGELFLSFFHAINDCSESRTRTSWSKPANTV